MENHLCMSPFFLVLSSSVDRLSIDISVSVVDRDNVDLAGDNWDSTSGEFTLPEAWVRPKITSRLLSTSREIARRVSEVLNIVEIYFFI